VVADSINESFLETMSLATPTNKGTVRKKKL
jgi:hypothetical protein